VAGKIKIEGDDEIIITNSSIEANGGDGGEIKIISLNGSVNITESYIQTNGGQGRGGAISVAGLQQTTINAATLEATGQEQGGTILIGNDAKNGRLPFSVYTSIDAQSIITASQLNSTNSNGGFVETSGQTISLLASINAGRGGMWLIDPTNVTISATAGTSSGTDPLQFTNQTNVSALQIQTAINNGTSVEIIVDGTITQSANLSFAPASGVNVSLTYNNRSGTAQAMTLTGTTTNTGAGNLTLNYLASGQIIINGAINSTSTGKSNVIAQSFYASNTTTVATGSNISIANNITTKGGFIALDGTGGSISSTGVITNGSITNGTVVLLAPGVIFNTTTTGTTTVTSATTGGNLAVTTSQNLKPGFGPNGAWYIGGSININSNPSGAAEWGFVFHSYATTYPIAAVGDINITVNNTSTSITASRGVIDITSSLRSYAGAINLIATTTGTTIAVSSSAAITAANGITITGTSGTAATVVNLGSSIITNAAGNITITGNNTAAGGNTGISSTGTITQNANGSNISFISNNIINQTGAIALAANISGTAANITYDTTTGTRASTITSGNVTIGAGTNASAINYVARSSGSALSPGSIGSGTVALPGSITIDNTFGPTSGSPASGFITASNAASLATTTGPGINIAGALTATGIITLNGASNSATGDHSGVIINSGAIAGNAGVSINGVTTNVNA
jgi:hypothetical protein